jgi:hypothetical protein
MPPSRPLSGRRVSSRRPDASRSAKWVPKIVRLAALAALRGSVSWMPRAKAAQPSRQGHSAQAGRRGVQMVAPRSNSAWAKVARPGPHRRIGREAVGEAGQLGLGGGQRRFDGEDARHHPLDVAVHRHHRLAERDRPQRRRRVGADARQRPPARRVARPAGGGDGACGGVQVAGAGVVAEAGPFLGQAGHSAAASASTVGKRARNRA